MNDIPACAHSPGRWKRQDRQFVCLDCGTTMVDPIHALMLAGLLAKAEAENVCLREALEFFALPESPVRSTARQALEVIASSPAPRLACSRCGEEIAQSYQLPVGGMQVLP